MSVAALLPRVRSALFEITTDEPGAVARRVLQIVCLLCAVLLLWATLAKLDVVAVAEGRLVPQTYVKIVQPAEGGIVKEILVREGDRVDQGQVLVRLDATLSSAEGRSIASRLDLKRLELRRIDAQMKGQVLAQTNADDNVLFSQVQLDAAARQRMHRDLMAQEEATLVRIQSERLAAQEALDKLQRTLPSYEEEARSYTQLAGQGLVGRLSAQERERIAIEKAQDTKSQEAHTRSLNASARAQERRLAQLQSAYRSELQSERVQATAEIAQLEEEATKQGFREGLLELKAPQSGIVKELATTTLGAVVQPGTVIVTLVPQDEPLLAEVYVQNQDIGFVQEGQAARIKLSAYPFTKYGMLEGTVRTLIADSSGANSSATPEKVSSDGSTGDLRFKAIVQLKTKQLEWAGGVLPIAAGMQVQAEIKQRERTVLEYLLSPVSQVAQQAGRER